MTAHDIARESSRQTNGQFGTQIRVEAAVALNVPTGNDIDGYSEACARVEADWHAATGNVEMLPDPERSERYTVIADQFADLAQRAANATPSHLIPGYDTSALNSHTGTVRAAADYATQARLNALSGPFNVTDIEAGGDRIAAQVFDTRDFTTSSGIPMRARIVRKGSHWGRTGSLVAKEDLVFFFDARYPSHPPILGHELDENRERNGQHIANYYVSTLTEPGPGGGLNLHGGEPDWTIDAATYSQVEAWLTKRARPGGPKFPKPGQ